MMGGKTCGGCQFSDVRRGVLRFQNAPYGKRVWPFPFHMIIMIAGRSRNALRSHSKNIPVVVPVFLHTGMIIVTRCVARLPLPIKQPPHQISYKYGAEHWQRPLASRLGPRELEHHDLVRSATRYIYIVAIHKDGKAPSQIEAGTL
jgi:hypothetical protein